MKAKARNLSPVSFLSQLFFQASAWSQELSAVVVRRYRRVPAVVAVTVRLGK